MDSGSMLVPNLTKGKTVLTISKNLATANPSDNALLIAERALSVETSNPTVSEGNVKFLEEWIQKFKNPPKSAPVKKD